MRLIHVVDDCVDITSNDPSKSLCGGNLGPVLLPAWGLLSVEGGGRVRDFYGSFSSGERYGGGWGLGAAVALISGGSRVGGGKGSLFSLHRFLHCCDHTFFFIKFLYVILFSII